MTELPVGFFWDEELQLGRETAELGALLWPNYLIEDSDIPDPSMRLEITREELAKRFPVWGIRRESDRRLVAYANAALVAVDERRSDLPEEGWRFAIAAGGRREKPNALCLLVANVDPEARGYGLAPLLIERAKQAAKDLGLAQMVAPVRPMLKHEHPFAAMSEYVQRLSQDAEAYDPWIRVHRKAGGQQANVCASSVEIKASLKKWRQWTGLQLTQSGDVVVPKGLVPLKVDSHRGIGVYREPGVWFRYAVS
jgi:GNAT superfamily N-acetyltransferase